MMPTGFAKAKLVNIGRLETADDQHISDICRDDPPWMQALNPSAFARAWFDQTGFARRAEMRLAATTVDDANWRDVLLPVARDLLVEGRANRSVTAF